MEKADIKEAINECGIDLGMKVLYTIAICVLLAVIYYSGFLYGNLDKSNHGFDMYDQGYAICAD